MDHLCRAGIHARSAADARVAVDSHMAAVARNCAFGTDGFTIATEHADRGADMNAVFAIRMRNLDACFFRIENLFVGCRAGQLAQPASGT